MIAYEAAAWRDLFEMVGAAAATLAGLIFVAVSLNHEGILEEERLPALAGRTLGVLIASVVFCAVGLAPGQSRVALGAEVLVIALVLAAGVVSTTVRMYAKYERRVWRANLVAVTAVVTVPALAAGVSLLACAGGGLYWLLGEFVAAIVTAATYGWVLLIEIRR